MPDIKCPNLVRDILTGLAIGCPRGIESADCLIIKTRQSSHSEKSNWIKSLTDDEILDIFSAHCDCLIINQTYYI
jgi:hypothetical protein